MRCELDFVDECYAGKDLSLLNKLTLVIPTYNRNFYLSRCLWYHAHFPFGQIIVADSSPEEKKVVNRETVAKICSFFDANVLYLEYEPETEKYGGDIYRKWADAMQHVKTEYSQFCTDKEFLIPTSLTQCIEFLNEYPDYVTAEAVVYKLSDSTKSGYNFIPWQNVPPVIEDTPEERLKTALIQTTGALFSTYRTIQHKKIYQNLIEYHIYDIRYGETAIEIQPLLMGKIHKYHDSVGRVRDVAHLKSKSIISYIDTNESSFTRYPRIEEYPQEVSALLLRNLEQCCISIITEQHQSSEYVENIVPRIFDTRYHSGVSVFDKSEVVRKLWNKLPLSLQRKIKQIIGMGDEIFSADDLGVEIKVIQSVVISTSDYHTNDNTISF